MTLDLCIVIHLIIYISSFSFHGIGNEAYVLLMLCYVKLILLLNDYCVVRNSNV
jgi:hypothetical protein